MTEKYLEWRRHRPGRSESAATYARDLINVSPQLLNDWMTKGREPAENENIEKLWLVFGDEIYDRLMPNPNDPLFNFP